MTTHNRHRAETYLIADMLLDFDRRPLRPRHIRSAFCGSKPDTDIVVYAVFEMINYLAGFALSKITMHDDITKKRWRTITDDVSYSYAAELVCDWRTHGADTDASLYDYVAFYVCMLNDMAREAPAYSLHPKRDMVMRNGRFIPKILDVDGVVFLPVP